MCSWLSCSAMRAIWIKYLRVDRLVKHFYSFHPIGEVVDLADSFYLT